MTLLMANSRVECAKAVARDRLERHPSNYSLAMIEAEELVRALEVLGVISFSAVERANEESAQ